MRELTQTEQCLVEGGWLHIRRNTDDPTSRGDGAAPWRPHSRPVVQTNDPVVVPSIPNRSAPDMPRIWRHWIRTQISN